MSIIVLPKGTLTAQQKGAISKKGIIIIECDEPEKVRILNPETTMDNSDWFMSALKSITVRIPVDGSEKFVNELYSRLSKKETNGDDVSPETKQEKKNQENKIVLKEPIAEYPNGLALDKTLPVTEGKPGESS